MSLPVPSFTLNNGVKIPGVGKGCWLGPDGGKDVALTMCKNALQVGYRHIDTAAGYANEELVGQAVRESGIPRSEIFVTTKIWVRNGHRVRAAFEDSLKALDIEYIDLYLVHWPMTHAADGTPRSFDEEPNFITVWKDMEKLLDTGKVRAIGVSNFSVQNLELLLKHATVVPAVNQVEAHPCLPQVELQTFCQEKGILLSAYSPLGQGNALFFEDADFVKVVEAHNATPAQIAISWLVQRGIAPIVKSANLERMKLNITLVELSAAEMDTIGAVHKKPNMHRSLLPYHATDGTVFGWTYKQLGWPMAHGGLVPSL
ncbi:hypothetical protein PHLGIDRAFT_128998 [Phlebiopsis gigantea 11061_1 CR5-6]|uniref:NADP-dependent oxidoreductase domain-containing protein n=1 Tax=Phlebiopsis gigantea (strain 11061_1 CR5-6) TaxID=745531 RepID=A0A0C3RVG8_PHLG1|nr:hypothetical protein PHLGIDRAFT_128998 [Phlebiopsis gigantea 11061_1 CR5-6]